MEKKTLGTYQIFVSSVIRGVSQGLFPKIIEANSILISFFRILIPTVFIYGYSFLKGDRIKDIFSRNKLIFHGVSVLVSFRVILFLTAYQLSSISVATLIFFASTVYISIFESRVMGISFSVRNFALSILSFLAIGFIILKQDVEVAFSNLEFLGYTLMFVASIVVVFENFIKKTLISRLNNTEWVFYQNFMGSVILLPALFLFPLPDIKNLGLLLLFALLVGVIAYVLSVAAMRKLRLTSHRIIGYVEPIVAIAIGALVFSEPITIGFIVVALIVFASIWLSKKEA